ncbi:MAG: hypothetical protein E6Q97_19445 [Desulfurellales bacterium]|nr:MAG: hypothetical protein E6Q97_19445 [Desulfurellales bacterium]
MDQQPTVKAPVFEEPASDGDLGDILTMIRAHYWTRAREMEEPDQALMIRSWGVALEGLSRRAIESALREWITFESWPPQASDLRKLALRQGATIYNAETVAYVRQQYERFQALTAGKS